MNKTVKVGLIGSGFVADIHAHAFKHFVRDAEVVAAASPTPGKAARFARERGIPNAFEEYRDLLAMKEIDMVTLGVPNDLHCQITLDAARVGKHVVCKKFVLKQLCTPLNEIALLYSTCRSRMGCRKSTPIRR